MSKLSFRRFRDHPEAAEVVAGWWFEQWGHEDPTGTFASTLAVLRAGEGKLLPVTVLAYLNDDLVGAAQLKAHELHAQVPALTPWLGNVFVAPEQRGAEIAAGLVAEIETLAREAGFRRLYLQTQALDGGLYARVGWQAVRRLETSHGTVMLMDRQWVITAG